jgi:hypothetical protein
LPPVAVVAAAVVAAVAVAAANSFPRYGAPSVQTGGALPFADAEHRSADQHRITTPRAGPAQGFTFEPPSRRTPPTGTTTAIVNIERGPFRLRRQHGGYYVSYR